MYFYHQAHSLAGEFYQGRLDRSGSLKSDPKVKRVAAKQQHPISNHGFPLHAQESLLTSALPPHREQDYLRSHENILDNTSLGS